ncbi:MAG: rhodanese-like domain-containing protein, partial [Clostridia bacterium]|nr:rhodanese-like domain-containing protein [Clostridia bacterium]
ACANAGCPNAACPNAAGCTAGVLGVDNTCPAAQGEACALASGLDSVMLPPGCSDVCDVIAEYHKLTPEQAKASMDAGEEYMLVDVRTQEEFDQKHIPGALVLPNEEIGDDAPVLLPDKDATILLYCRSGRRSREAAEKLVAIGYTNVYDFGGIIDWPYETIES